MAVAIKSFLSFEFWKFCTQAVAVSIFAMYSEINFVHVGEKE